MARAHAANACVQSDSIKGLAQSIAKPAYTRLLTAEPALRRAVPTLIIAFLVTICLGAFVQVITRETRTTWRKTFSGWLYKESPSINVVEHPIYDVWVKACKMRHPDIGPETIVARGDDSGATSTRSRAVKSPSATDNGPPPPPDSAADSATE